VALVDRPPDPPPALKPGGWKFVEPVAKPPDPPAELPPKTPVKPVGPVAMPPEPPEVLVPKPPLWALAGTGPASIVAARQTDDRIVRKTRLRFMAFSIQVSFSRRAGFDCFRLAAHGGVLPQSPGQAHGHHRWALLQLNFISRKLRYDRNFTPATWCAGRHEDDVCATNVGARVVHATRVCLTCNNLRTESKTSH
jgi:hypothetical protein